MLGRHRTKTTILNLLVETFFAVLPLIVLGAVWPSAAEAHDESFWSGPELSMTSCILYGLALARFLQGAVFVASRSRQAEDGEMERLAASYAVLLLLPLLGVILSVVLIGRSVHTPGDWKLTALYIVNLFAAILAFFLLGGHGIKHAEGGSTD